MTGTHPSTQHFLGRSLPLKKGYGLYVLVLRKWIGDAFTGDWIYDYRLYLGSGTEKRRGIVSRFGQYDRDEAYSSGVLGAIHFGWQIAHRSIIAWAPLVEPVRHFQLQMLFLTLEATFSHVFAMHDHNYMKSLEKSFWDPSTLDYQGLCSGSSLREIYALQGFFDLSEEELRAEVEDLEKKAKERKFLSNQIWNSRELSSEEKARKLENQTEWRKIPRVAERQLEMGKVYDKKRTSTPEGKAKKAAKDKAYAQTPKGKASQVAKTKRYMEKKKLARDAKEKAKRE